MVTDELVDQHLDAILKASGSALRHYTMQKTLDDMRAAVRLAMASTPQQGMVTVPSEVMAKAARYDWLMSHMKSCDFWFHKNRENGLKTIRLISSTETTCDEHSRPTIDREIDAALRSGEKGTP